LLRKDGEMLAFDHIPTGNHHNNKEGFKILIGREGERSRAECQPDSAASLTSGLALLKRRGRYFSPGKGRKIFRSRARRRAFDPVQSTPYLKFAGSGRRDGSFPVEQRDGFKGSKKEAWQSPPRRRPGGAKGADSDEVAGVI
jgi:hypothetical protein